MLSATVTKTDKIISALTYITGGTAGFIWLICCAVSKKTPSYFLLFNIYQSIGLALFLGFANLMFTLIYDMLIMVPYVNILANSLKLAIYTPVVLRFSVVGLIIFVFYLYLVIMAVFGKIGYIPWITNIISYQIDNINNGGK